MAAASLVYRARSSFGSAGLAPAAIHDERRGNMVGDWRKTFAEGLTLCFSHPDLQLSIEVFKHLLVSIDRAFQDGACDPALGNHHPQTVLSPSNVKPIISVPKPTNGAGPVTAEEENPACASNVVL